MWKYPLGYGLHFHWSCIRRYKNRKHLSSQYFANHYFSVADHYLLEQSHVNAFVRYMDDIVIFDNDKERLKRKGIQLQEYVGQKLCLQFHPMIMNRTKFGIPFLGYVVYPYYLRLNHLSRQRFRHKVEELNRKNEIGELSETECLQRFSSMFDFVNKANAKSFCLRIIEKSISIG